jgi:hypothetical protein
VQLSKTVPPAITSETKQVAPIPPAEPTSSKAQKSANKRDNHEEHSTPPAAPFAKKPGKIEVEKQAPLQRPLSKQENVQLSKTVPPAITSETKQVAPIPPAEPTSSKAQNVDETFKGLSDSQARDLLKKQWGGSVLVIPVGKLKVIGGPAGSSKSPDLSKGEISEGRYLFLQNAADLGFLTIKKDPNHSMQGNDISLIYVDATAKAKEAARRGGVPQTEGALKFLRGDPTIEKIVKNEAHKIGSDEYRVVTGTYNMNWSPELQQLMGEEKLTNHRFVALLKYDPLAAQWKVSTYDHSSKDGTFSTNKVSAALSKLGL